MRNAGWMERASMGALILLVTSLCTVTGEQLTGIKGGPQNQLAPTTVFCKGILIFPRASCAVSVLCENGMPELVSNYGRKLSWLGSAGPALPPKSILYTFFWLAFCCAFFVQDSWPWSFPKPSSVLSDPSRLLDILAPDARQAVFEVSHIMENDLRSSCRCSTMTLLLSRFTLRIPGLRVVLRARQE